MFKKFFHGFVLLAFVAGLFAVTPASPAAASADGKGVSPAGMLNPDGTLNLSEGFSGSLDLNGWTVQMDPQLGPVFSQEEKTAYLPNNVPTVGDWENLGEGGSAINYYIGDIEIVGSDVYVGGGFTDAGSVPEADHVARWDGTTWHALGSNGAGDGSLTNHVYDLYYDGTYLYVGGTFTNVNNNGISLGAADNIARWDGTNWSALGSNGASNGSLSGAVRAITGDGTNLYVGGQYSNVNNNGVLLTEADYIAKWDGTSWSALGNNGAGVGALNSSVFALAMDSGTLYVGGQFTNAGGVAEADYFAVWNGSAWSALGNNGAGNGAFDTAGSVAAIAIDSTGLVYAGGNFSDVNNGATNMPDADDLVVWNGSTWSAVGTDGTSPSVGQIDTIVIDGSDNVYVGGYFIHVINNGTTIPTADKIAKWDGSNWSGFGTNGTGDGAVSKPSGAGVFAIGLDGTDVLIGGYFEDVSNEGTPLPFSDYFAKWATDHWEEISSESNGPIANAPNLEVLAIAVMGTDVYVGGSFNDMPNASGVNAVTMDNIAKWDGSQWSALGGSLGGTVTVLFVDGSDLYAGGGFTNAGGDPNADYFAKWNGSSWSAVGHNGAGNGSLNSSVMSIAKLGSDIYVGGYFTNVTNVDTSVLVDADYIARWDGSNWHALSTGAGSPLIGPAFALASNGSLLFAGGDFANANGIAEADFIASWDGTSWAALGNNGVGTGPLSSSVYALYWDGAYLYAGGQFYNAGGVPQADVIARWNGTNWSALGSNAAGTDGSLLGTVRAISGLGGKLYVGGEFINVSDSSGAIPEADYIARWDGLHWSALGSNGSGDGSLNKMVKALAMSDALYAGGRFNDVNNGGTILTTADFIAAYGIDTTIPQVASIARANPNPTAQASVDFTVTFSDIVNGVDAFDFSLVQSGVSGASITGVNGSNDTYTVTVNTGIGNGSLGLNLLDDDSITDTGGDNLGGLGAGNGDFVGEVYTVTKTAPAQITPANGAVLDNRRPFFDWSDFAGAKGYQIQVSKTMGFGTTLINVSLTGATNSQYTATKDLPANTLLYWRVRAKLSATKYTVWSPSSTFVTGNPPSVPSPVSPANNALVTNINPTLDWSDSTVPAGTTFLEYQVQVDNDIDFSSPATERFIGGVTSSSSVVGPLDVNTKYYWRVRAWGTNGHYSGWSLVRTFREAMPTPTLLSPIGGITVVSLKPLFDWSDVAGATGYTIQVSLNINFSSTAINVTINTPTSQYVHSMGLQAGKLYYWRVRANGPNGPSVWSTVESFHTP